MNALALDRLAAHQPVEKSTRGARIGLNRALTAHFAAARRCFTHGGGPGLDIGGLYHAHQGEVPSLFNVRSHLRPGRALPLRRVVAMSRPLLVAKETFSA